MTACPYCGKDVPRGTLNRHMRQDCPKASTRQDQAVNIARVHLLQLTLDELNVIEDALTYYRMSTDHRGHTVADIQRVERKIGRYVITAERAEAP